MAPTQNQTRDPLQLQPFDFLRLIVACEREKLARSTVFAAAANH
jgi:hypothetical protein